METIQQAIRRKAAGCTCGNHHPLALETIMIEAGALKYVAPYLIENSWRRTVIVADDHTCEAAGQQLMDRLSAAGIDCHLCLVKPDRQGDVVADEAALVQVMLEISPDDDILVAVGAGTIHDMVRWIASKMNKPFVSVPTAPSVDGFTSKGAPILIRGEKKTIPAGAPVALFADLEVLGKAPAALIAAGYGDMLGKYTSLFDWTFSHWIADEPYCPAAAEITAEALSACVDHTEEIARRSEEGIRILMSSLIQSGLAMQLFGQSHPASGSEHHLSHYWEMEYLCLGKKQLLHGAKVGVASMEISALYHKLGSCGEFPLRSGLESTDLVKGDRIRARWEDIRKRISEIPSPDRLRELLGRMEGPTAPEELGIGSDLLQRSMREAHRVRDRYTLLKAFNELGAGSAHLT